MLAGGLGLREKQKKNNEHRFYMKFFKTGIFVVFWIISLLLSICHIKHACYNEAIWKERLSYEKGLSHAKKAISCGPYIKNSLLASEYIDFDLIDTYFAKGTTLLSFLYEIARSEGLERKCWGSDSNVIVAIDGGVESIDVGISMIRSAYINVRNHDAAHYKNMGFYSGEYVGDMYIQDSIPCYWKTKHFPPGTKYEEVSKWLENEIRDLCRTMKKKSEEVVKKFNEVYADEMAH